MKGWQALQGRLEVAVVATWAGRPRPCSVRHSWQEAASKLQNMAAARPPKMAVHDLHRQADRSVWSLIHEDGCRCCPWHAGFSISLVAAVA